MRRGVSKLVRIALSAVLAVGLIPAFALADTTTGEPENVEGDIAVAAQDESAAVKDSGPDDFVPPTPEDSITVMELDEEYSVEVGPRDSAYFEFTAPVEALYAFSSFDCGDTDPAGYLYADESFETYLAYNDDAEASDTLDFEILIPLNEGDTVYLAAASYSSSEASYNVKVREYGDLYDISNYYVYHDDYYALAGDRDSFVTTVSLPSRELIEGVHYEVYGYLSGSDEFTTEYPDQAGYYTACIRGIEPYYDELRLDFEVKLDTDLSSATVTFDGNEYLGAVVYTGEPVDLQEEIVTRSGAVLEEGVHYVTKYLDEEYNPLSSAPVDPGSYRVYFVAIEESGYTGYTDPFYFDVVDVFDFSYCSVSVSADEYLYTGQEIEPKPHVWNYFNDRLVEGRDYAVSYEDNIGSADDLAWGLILVTPMGDYSGDPLTYYFPIVPYLDIESLIDAGEFAVEWEDGSGSSDLVFFADGRPVTPDVALAEDDHDLVSGVDYTLDYVDEEGNSVVPSEPGDYYIAVIGTEDGVCRGEGYIPFTVVAAYDIEEADLYPCYNYAFNDEGMMVVEGYDQAEDVLWFGYYWGAWAGIEMAPGYDFTYEVTEIEDGVYEVAFTGIGRFEGEVSFPFILAAEEEPSLEYYSWFVDGQFANLVAVDFEDRVKVGLDQDGSVIEPLVTSWIANGLDFKVAGLFGDDGSPVAEAEEGDLGYVLVEGMGEFAGLSLEIPVAFTEAGDLGWSEDIDIEEYCDYYFDAPSGWDSEAERSYCAWLKSDPTNPNVTLFDYFNELVLEVETHYTVSYQRVGDKMLIEIEAIEGSGYTGSISETIDLVDKFDLNHFADISSRDSYRFPAGKSIDPYWQIYADVEIVEGVDYLAVLTNSAGQEVTKLTATDTYTLEVQGIGNWTGSVKIEMKAVAFTNDGMSLAYADSGNFVTTYLFEGHAIEPDLELGYGGRDLVEGEDYTVEYFNNDAPGAAYALATAVEGSGYCGTFVWSYVIEDSIDISQSAIIYYDEEFGYYELYNPEYLPVFQLGLNGAAEPDFQSSMELDPKYYDVTYGNNTAEGLAWVKITGKNGCTGELKANFIISGVKESVWTTFPDVITEVAGKGGPDKLWYVRDGWLDYVVGRGLMGGYTSGANAGCFGPHDKITRASVATMLYRAACAENPGLERIYGSTTDKAAYGQTASFSDMQAGRWYTAAINWARDAGIMTGDGTTNFTTVRPNDTVTRQELAVMLARYANDGDVPAMSLDPSVAEGLGGIDEMASWAKNSMFWALNEGVMSGAKNADGTRSLNPKMNAERCEAAKMFTVVLRDVL